MAPPFTRWATFIAQNVPKVTALFLNQLQDALAGAAYPAYDRIKYVAYSDNQSSVSIPVIAPYMALDSATSQYVGMPAATSVTVSSGFTANVWQYVYVRVTNSVPAYSVSTTAPEASLRYKSGDETYRYVCAVFVSSSGYIRRFNARDGRYTFNEKIYVNAASDATGNTGPSAWTPLAYPTNSFPSTASFSRIYVMMNSQIAFATALFRSYGSNATSEARSLITQGSGTSVTYISNSEVFEFYGTSGFYWILSGNPAVRIVLDGFTE